MRRRAALELLPPMFIGRTLRIAPSCSGTGLTDVFALAGAEAASAAAPAAAAATPSGYDSGSGRPKPKGRAILPQPTPRVSWVAITAHAC